MSKMRQSHHTKWIKPSPKQSVVKRSWQTRSIPSGYFRLLSTDVEDAQCEVIPVPFIESGLLIFHTESVHCQLCETVVSDFAERKGLTLFCVEFNDRIIGEIKIDDATLSAFAGAELPVTVDSVELISIFETDFGTSVTDSSFWVDSLSRMGLFCKDFSDMMGTREDKSMRIVLWITWQGDVAH